jgi:hypothetical protein
MSGDDERDEELSADQLPVADQRPVGRATTVADVLSAPILQSNLRVERKVEGKQVVSYYVDISGQRVGGLSATYHLFGVEGNFQPPPVP